VDDEVIAKQVVDCAVKVPTALGAGLLESADETCLAHELVKCGREVKRQVPMPVQYDGLELNVGCRIEMLVSERVIIEVKAVDTLLPIHTAQLLTCSKLGRPRLGFLLNFNVEHMRNGVKRVVNGF
jgi:GxxExxY protein